jgi:hypothetical protein
MTEQELDHIEALWKATTQGEWYVASPRSEQSGVWFVADAGRNGGSIFPPLVPGAKSDLNNCNFVANAHQSIPALLAEVRQLRAILYQDALEDREDLRLAYERGAADAQAKHQPLYEAISDVMTQYGDRLMDRPIYDAMQDLGVPGWEGASEADQAVS